MSWNKIVKHFIYGDAGQVLIELILAIVIAAVFLVALATITITAREGFARSNKSLEASLILQKEVEAIRSVKETAWNSISTPGTYHIEQSGNGWSASSGTINEGDFTRSFVVEDVCRVSYGTEMPISCGGVFSTNDPSTKKITVTVSWSFFGTHSVSTSFYISRYFGNAIWTQTTQAEFDAGEKYCSQVINNAGGEIALRPIPPGNWNAPSIIATRNFNGTQDANDVWADCDKAYIVTASRSGADFFIYNVTDPANPLLLGSLDLSATGFAITISGRYAYVATSHNTRELTIIDISNPNSPFIAGSRDIPTSADGRGIAVSASGSTTFAYVVTDNNTSGAGAEFYKYDVTNPATTSPPLGSLNLNAPARDIFVLGNYAYVASTHDSQELQVVDISNSALVESFNAPGTSDALAVSAEGSIVYLGAGTLLYLLNINNPLNIPAPLSTFNAVGTIRSVYVLGNLLFIGNTQSGSELKIVDASNPSSPNLYGSANLGGVGIGIFVFSSYAYVATNVDSAEFRVILGGNGSGGYQTFGTFESQIFDSGVVSPGAGFNRAILIPTAGGEPAGTNLRFQIATSNSNGGPWNYVGPDGQPNTYFDNAGTVNLNQVSGRYFRFKVTLTGNFTSTPILDGVIVNYSP